MNNTKKWILAALLCAFTTVATMLIQIPTPLFGYIHPGDAFVFLCSILISPTLGALAAGLGSMFADVFSSYLIFAPATFVIKALAAWLVGTIYHRKFNSALIAGHATLRLLLACISGSVVVSGGYFLYEAFLFGVPASLANIPFNLVQNVVGTVLVVILTPLLIKIKLQTLQSD